MSSEPLLSTSAKGILREVSQLLLKNRIDLGRTWGAGTGQDGPPWRVQLTELSTPGLVFPNSGPIFPSGSLSMG